MNRRYLDETFLQVHPATAAWFAQRDLCRRCAWMAEPEEGKGMRCTAASADDHAAAVGSWGGYRGPIPLDSVYCIDARLPGAPCGPEGSLFAPVKETA